MEDFVKYGPKIKKEMSSCQSKKKSKYRISSYGFRENNFFVNLEIVANSNSCRNGCMFYFISRIFVRKLFIEETIQGQKTES